MSEQQAPSDAMMELLIARFSSQAAYARQYDGEAFAKQWDVIAGYFRALLHERQATRRDTEARIAAAVMADRVDTAAIILDIAADDGGLAAMAGLTPEQVLVAKATLLSLTEALKHRPAPPGTDHFATLLAEAEARGVRKGEMSRPTWDAYMAACRALHHRTHELRKAGVEPEALRHDSPHHPDGELMKAVPVEQTEVFQAGLRRAADHAWQPIETAPKTDANRVVYILIGDGICLPDIVSWRPERPARTDRYGTFHHAVPEGWFLCGGGRSRLDGRATYWAPIPEYLPAKPAGGASDAG